MSMKPGQTTASPASTTSAAFSGGTAPGGVTAATRSPARATSPRNQGLPLPSTTRPPRISTSQTIS